MEKFNDKKVALSEFNEAGYQILRLHDHWNDCSKFSRVGNYDMWKWTLDMIWLELSPDAEQGQTGRSQEQASADQRLAGLCEGRPEELHPGRRD